MTSSPTPLIPRRALYGSPSRLDPRLSPDGRYIAWIAPWEGVMNVWVAPRDRLDQARPVTREAARPVAHYMWSPASDRILYIGDQAGAENFHLFGAPLNGGRAVDYTPFPQAQVTLVRASADISDALLITLNHRDPRWRDVYRLTLSTGALDLVFENLGRYDLFFADRNLDLVAASRLRSDGGFVLDRFIGEGPPRSVLEYGLEDALTTRVVGARDRKAVYLLDSRGRDKAVLTLVDLDTGEAALLAEDARADLHEVLEHPLTGEVEACAADHQTIRWQGLTPALTADIERLDAATDGVWKRISQTDDGRYWTVESGRGATPPVYFLYDRTKGKLEPLFSSRPDLDDAPLAVMTPVEITARDGLNLVGYLTLPLGARPAEGFPMVLRVHGGPWDRDVYRFNPTHQWLANRGYAVLSVNFRGSTGFGKAFLNAGNLEWGGRMQDDLIDAVEWAVAQGIAARDRVAIFGGSYGGFAALTGLTRTPDLFACAVDIVGPSNLLTMIETIPPYWQSLFIQMAERMGDPRNDEGRALLTERSPLTHVERIRRPLLIAQGANDPRVHKRESDQIVAAMKRRDIPVSYLLYPDEGHSLARPANLLSFTAIAEQFLAIHLGGLAEPVGDDLRGASVQVEEGCEFL